MVGYRWIDYPNSGYLHLVHNHGNGQESTSNIEQLWAYLKSIIKNLYYISNLGIENLYSEEELISID